MVIKKEVEYQPRNDSSQVYKCTLTDFDWQSNKYRIKPEPTYRPFKDVKECCNELFKHQPFGWLLNKPKHHFIFSVHAAYILTSDNYDFEDAFNTFTFADGTPFGIKED